jgi:hypothetical protein
MFGGFGFVGALNGAPQGGPPAGPGGGFPGIFPGAGVSNSGWAGFKEWKDGQPVCTPEDIKKSVCVMGPPASLL